MVLLSKIFTKSSSFAHSVYCSGANQQDLYTSEGHWRPKQQMLVAGCSERRVPHLARSGGDHETYCLSSCPPHKHCTLYPPGNWGGLSTGNAAMVWGVTICSIKSFRSWDSMNICLWGIALEMFYREGDQNFILWSFVLFFFYNVIQYSSQLSFLLLSRISHVSAIALDPLKLDYNCTA